MNVLRILLVDDSRDFLYSAAAFLSKQEGVEIVGLAQSADEAMEELDAFAPDVVLMDIAMPGMNGFDAASRMKSHPNAPKVIIVTSHDCSEYRAGAEAAGSDGFAVKDRFVESIGVVIRAFAAGLDPHDGLIECHSSSVVCPCYDGTGKSARISG
ncbi:MAG: hypothetical protein QOD99_1201 [Chthoniobacter sp.]|jgi:DNA-binding NarL/FixJ family response regulator|nr:hypothetical protein [Chthoniobacter sp.]